jgi:hypothetical protein
LQPLFQRNHPSWENDEYAQEVLLQVLAEWFNAGSLEYVERFHRLPHCILALGSVPKSTHPLRRIITDARPINIYAESWRVKYATVGEFCLMLNTCDLIWVRDLKNAYHLVRLGGCRGRTQKLLRWITNDDGTGYVPAPTFRSGCGPGDCLGFCDESMFGMCAAGHVARFAVTQFGHKVSNGPLWVITQAVCAYAARVHKVDISAFVDDLFNKMNMRPHGPCKGFKGEAPFLVPFNKFIGGPDSVREWDECKDLTHPLRTTMGNIGPSECGRDRPRFGLDSISPEIGYLIYYRVLNIINLKLYNILNIL